MSNSMSPERSLGTIFVSVFVRTNGHDGWPDGLYVSLTIFVPGPLFHTECELFLFWFSSLAFFSS